MTSNARMLKWIEILRELAEHGGSEEFTQLYPNAEIIDPDLATGFIKVRGRTGAYEAAVKTAGLVYAIGDFVNILYMRGTEPVVIGYGSKSSTGVSEGAWPFTTDCATIDPTSAYVDYASLVLGQAGESSPITFVFGPTNNTVDGVDLTSEEHLLGLNPHRSRLMTTTAAYVLSYVLSAITSHYITNVQSVGTEIQGIKSGAANNLYLDTCIVYVCNSGAGDSVGVKITTGEAVIQDCDISICSTGYALSVTGGAVVDIYGGHLDGGASGGALYVDATSTVNIYGLPKIEGTVTIAAGATINGMWIDGDGDLHQTFAPNKGDLLVGTGENNYETAAFPHGRQGEVIVSYFYDDADVDLMWNFPLQLVWEDGELVYEYDEGDGSLYWYNLKVVHEFGPWEGIE